MLCHGASLAKRGLWGITERVRAALLARKADANEGWVFPSARAESGHLETVPKQFERAKRMASLPESIGCTVHVWAGTVPRLRSIIDRRSIRPQC